jgi:hypothetical protein
MEQNAKHPSENPTAEERGVPVEIPGAGLAFDRCDEISLGQLSVFDRIVITTRNHTYEVVVTSPDTGEVLVRGGTVFPRFTAARLNGSVAGGSSIAARSVNVGVRVEFAIEGYVPVVTTRVQTLAVAHAA